MKLTVLGPGCWGLTLAWLLNDNFDEVCVWGRTQDISDELKQYKRTTKPLTVQLDDKVVITDNLKQAIDGAEIILLVVATSGIRPVCQQLKEAGLKDDQILVNLSKGLELPSLKKKSGPVSFPKNISSLAYIKCSESPGILCKKDSITFELNVGKYSEGIISV